MADLIIGFVCSGGYCRSAIAKGLLEKHARQAGLSVLTWNAGTSDTWDGEPPEKMFVDVVHQMGATWFTYQPHQLRLDEVFGSDLILTIGPDHKTEVIRQYPAAEGRVLVLSELIGGGFEVPDPYPNRPRNAPPLTDARPVEVVACMIDDILARALETIVSLACQNRNGVRHA